MPSENYLLTCLCFSDMIEDEQEGQIETTEEEDEE